MSHGEGLSPNGDVNRRGGEVLPDGMSSSLMAAAHELKSPLVLIRQLAFAAGDDGHSDDERARLLNQLTLVADRGLRLTTDLTRTAHLEDSLFATEPINAQQVCERIVKELAPLYEQYGRVIKLEAPRRSGSIVLAHRELLASVIYHFADNALHYGDDTGPVRVFLRARPSEGRLQIHVRDHGPRLSLSDWRAARAASKGLPTRPHASGLGLMIAEQFSHAMGGSIGLTRHRDGATFYVELPLSEQLSLL